MLSDNQKIKIDFNKKVREYVVKFVREVEKAKTNPIFKRYSVIRSHVPYSTDDYNMNFPVYDYDIEYKIKPTYPLWFIDDSSKKLCIDLNSIIDYPKDVALSLIGCKANQKYDEDYLVKQRISVISHDVMAFLYEELVSEMTKCVNEEAGNINYKNYENYLFMRNKVLDNKSNYRASDRQRPIASSLRSHKSHPKRKSAKKCKFVNPESMF